jgi:hypothetical protein
VGERATSDGADELSSLTPTSSIAIEEANGLGSAGVRAKRARSTIPTEKTTFQGAVLRERIVASIQYK